MSCHVCGGVFGALNGAEGERQCVDCNPEMMPVHALALIVVMMWVQPSPAFIDKKHHNKPGENRAGVRAFDVVCVCVCVRTTILLMHDEHRHEWVSWARCDSAQRTLMLTAVHYY